MMVIHRAQETLDDVGKYPCETGMDAARKPTHDSKGAPLRKD